MESKSILMEKYELGRLLGQGTFAKVYLAKNLKSGQTVAIKAFDKEKVFKVGLTEQIKREISVMKMVNHPNIIKLYEVMATRKKIYFVIEYAKGGELFQKIAKGGRVKEEIAHKYFKQLIEAVDFCHSRGIFHRDLKLENLLLDEEDNLKVTDFGLSALIGSDRQDGLLLHTSCGTPAYVAPDVLSKKGYDGAKTDIWSCGVILFVLVAGYLPFHDSNLMEMYRKIQKGEIKCPSWFSSRLKKLLYKMLDPNPLTRLTVEGIKGMSWYRKGFDRDQGTKEKKIKENVNVVKKERREKMQVASMNAFDIISLSSGFDLSGFFVERENRNETWFTCRQPVSVLVSRLEEVAKKLKLRVRKKENGVVKMVARNGGRKGLVEIDAEIFQIDPSSYMVEIKKSNGDTLEYQKILKEEIRPGLKDIVWTWQGDEVDLV